MNIEEVSLNDPEVWDMIGQGRTKGCFQIESHLGKTWCKKVKPRSIQELSDVIALIRPGVLGYQYDGKSMAQHYADRKAGIDKSTPLHPLLGDLLSNTYNIMLFQEQIMRIASVVAGFNPEETDVLRKCIAKGSYVMTSSGPVLIEDIGSKYKILTLNDGKLCYRKIKKVWSTGIQNTIKIKTKIGNYISLTKNHQVFTNKGWIDAGDVKVGDFVTVPKKYVYKGRDGLSVDEAVFLGYFISEGCYTEASAPKITNSDPEIIEEIKRCMCSLFGESSYKIYSHKNGCVDIYMTGLAKEYICNKFEKNKSKDKFIPRYVINSTKGCTDAFIGAYFSGDGTVEVNGVSFSSASEKTIVQLQQLLLRDSIYGTISKKWNRKYERFYYELCVSVNKFVSSFYKTYGKYICSEKTKRIERLLSKFECATNSFDSFRIPNNIVSECFGGENLSRYLPNGSCCGSIYNKSLTEDKARYINSFIGSELVNDILNSDFHYSEVTKIEDGGEIETFDFEVDSHEHCGFINGILVHNSVGKKDAKKLFALQEQFVAGCINTSNLKKEEAELIFDNFKKSARYLFNLSHSISYAYLAYQTAYMKCHYPEEFFKNWLQQADEKIDPDMEKRQLIMAAKAEGITVKGPHISKLEEDFFWDEDCIRYGICNVKSVGKSHLERLKSHLEKLDSPTWSEILFSVLPNVNKTAVENLIMCGAFSGFGRSRTEMIHHFNCVNEFTDKELAKLAEFKGDPVQIIEDFLAKGSKKNGGFIATEARVSKVESLLARLKNPGRSLSDAPSVYAKVEEKLLGYPISNSELDGCSDASHATSSCLVVSEGMTEQCTLAVIITKIREHKTKNGDIMCFLSAEDDSGELENIVVFPDTYSLIKEFLYERSTVLLSGQMKDRERGSFIVDNVFQI